MSNKSGLQYELTLNMLNIDSVENLDLVKLSCTTSDFSICYPHLLLQHFYAFFSTYRRLSSVCC